MAKTYDAIATTTLGSSTSTVTFSSIPQTYTDLVLIISGKLASSAESILHRFNSDSGANYSFTYTGGNGSGTFSGRATSTTFGLGGYMNSSEQSGQLVYFMNYSNSTTYKTALDRRGLAGGFTGMDVSLWRNTAAITRIDVFPENGAQFATDTVLTLYGIKAA